MDPVLAHRMKYLLCTHCGLHLLASISLTLLWRDQLGMPLVFHTVRTNIAEIVVATWRLLLLLSDTLSSLSEWLVIV